MKSVWSPEMASKAFIDTVKSCKTFDESSAAELVSAMAAGWNAQLVVETWRRGGFIATSVGLAVATQHTGGRHVCVVSDEETKAEYVEAMRGAGRAADVVGRPEEAMEGLEGIDFLVVDCRRNDFGRILTAARLGRRGAVVVCKNASSTAAADDLRWRGGKLRIVHSVFLPVGNGLLIAHVSAAEVGGGAATGKGRSRWIKLIDRRSGEEIVFRR